MLIAAIIPARYGSTRFPGKPLAPIAGKPMIQHVYERVTQAAKISSVHVATDDDRIARAVIDFGGDVIMTEPELANGTERVAAAALEIRADIIINVQCDEPLIAPEVVDASVNPLLSDTTLDVSTPIARITHSAELADPAVVKVVMGMRNRALYFSRAAIPFQRDLPMERWLDTMPYWKHIGLYAFRRSALEQIVEEEPTDLERSEQLEQLRFLAYGYSITCVETNYESISVDRPEHVALVEARLAAMAV